jgi:TetR/AcrR family transcriptional regulator
LSTSVRREREKAQRRLDILDAARLEFFEHGFHRPTVDDIAARAEVSKGTIYLYFASKEEILAHLLLEGLELLLDGMQNSLSACASTSAEAALYALAGAYLRFSQLQPSYFRLIMAFDRGRFEGAISRELHQQVLNASLQALDLLAQQIRAGMESGEFRPGEVRQAAGSVWAALNGVLVLMAHPLRRHMLQQDVESLFEATIHLVMVGLKAPLADPKKEAQA